MGKHINPHHSALVSAPASPAFSWAPSGLPFPVRVSLPGPCPGSHTGCPSATLVPRKMGMQKDLVTLMVNFTWQLDWATRSPDIWSHVILGSLFMDEISICTSRRCKQSARPKVGGPRSIRGRPEWSKQAASLLLPGCLPTGTLAFPVIRLERKPWLFLGVRPAVCWDPSPWVPLGLLLANCPAELGSCQPLWSCEPISCNNSLHTHLDILLVLETSTGVSPEHLGRAYV